MRTVSWFNMVWKCWGHTQRIGLQEMMDMAGIAANEVTEETVGFQIAPRLNAFGPLG